VAEKLNALVTAPSFLPDRGGLETLAFRLVQDASRIAPFVVAPETPGSEAFDVEHGLAIRRTPNTPAGGRRAMTRLAVAAVRETHRLRPDVVLSMHLGSSYCAPLLRKALAVPFVQYVHARELVQQPRLARFMLERAAATIAVSSYTAGLALERGAPADRLHTIPPGVDLRDAVARPREAPPTLVTVARLDDEYKGHDVVLQAMRRIRAVVPDARWVVVGDGALRTKLEEEARVLGLADAVDFRGAVTDAERDLALDSADVFVMASRIPPSGAGGEGFGIVFLEASARGLPIVAGRAGGAVDAVDDGVTGILVDPESPEEVADAVLSILTNRDQARAFGQAGVVWSKNFAWPTIIDRVEEVVCQVGARRVRPEPRRRTRDGWPEQPRS
jgi:phosphatidylinositol alpha-1,6-mannosyltransferase